MIFIYPKYAVVLELSDGTPYAAALTVSRRDAAAIADTLTGSTVVDLVHTRLEVDAVQDD